MKIMAVEETHEKRTSYELVRDWYIKFKQQEHISSRPGLDEENISPERLVLKLDLIAEEFIELVAAVFGKTAAVLLKIAWQEAKSADDGTRDMVEFADALCDLDFVIAGAALETGSPHDALFREVFESNLSKLDANGEPILSDGVTPAAYDGEIKPLGKILKGPNFYEPRIKKILEAHGYAEQ